MIKLDDDLLQELGLASLPPEEKKKLLAHIYETLEMRVGMKLAERMSDAQLAEFEQFIDRNDEAGALHWLETNFPDYKDVVAAEFDVLKKEVAQAAPQILAASTTVPPQQGVAASDPQAYNPAAATAAGPMGPMSGQQQFAQQQPVQPPYQPMPQQPLPPQPGYAPQFGAQQPMPQQSQYPQPQVPPQPPAHQTQPQQPSRDDYDLAA